MENDVDKSFEILLVNLNTALIEVREMAAESMRQGNYDAAQKLLNQAQQVDAFTANLRAKQQEWQHITGEQVSVQSFPQPVGKIGSSDKTPRQMADLDQADMEETETSEVQPEPSDCHTEEGEKLSQSLAETFNNVESGDTEDNTYHEAEAIGQWFQDSTSDTTPQRKGRSAGRSNPRERLSRGEGTPHSAYRLPLLRVLVEMGGEAPMQEVLKHVRAMMENQLKPVDYETVSQNVPRWRKHVEWQRYKMKNEGLLRDDSPHGIWAISEKGRRYLQEHDGK